MDREGLELNYDKWLWGKKEPFCSLSRHMIAVGACTMEYLLARSNHGILYQLCDWMNMSTNDLVQTFAYVAALHDIGKAHPSFQRYDDDDTPAYRIHNYRHEQYSEILLNSLWIKRGWPRKNVRFLSSVVRLHHQGKGRCELNGHLPERWKEIQNSLEERMWQLFQPCRELTTFRNVDPLGVLLSAILILCDWIASSKNFETSHITERDDLETLTNMRIKARHLMNSYKLISDSDAAYPTIHGFTDFWTGISREQMRPVQSACETIGEYSAVLTIIEAPMGEGKTEAALYVAGRLCELFDKKGVYMALPTAATSNQMVSRVRKMLKEHQSGDVRLMHSMAWLVDEQTVAKNQFDTEDSQYVEDWLRPLRRGLLSENAVGTVDQAMAAATRVKYGFLRLAGLTQKILIIDEIHAYDIFMSTIIARLLEWCRALNIPVIMISATLQNKQKRFYLSRYGIKDLEINEAYPLVTQVMGDGLVVQTQVNGTHMKYALQIRKEKAGGDIAKVANLVQKRIINGGCICVMMNTVKQAQAVYKELKKNGETEIMLFHARFTAKRRAEIEQCCLKLFGRNGMRPKRMILVCTQVVEQSLDVDFDLLITQLAPMDLLLQRAGRVHRHDGRRRPRGMDEPAVEIIIPDDDAESNIEKRYWQFGGIYPPEVMKNTEDLLNNTNIVSVPKDVRACVEQAYLDIEDEKLESIIRHQLEIQMRISNAEGELLPPPNKERFLGQTPSIADSLDMEENNEGLFMKSAKTRDGGVSQRFAFLPSDFPEYSSEQNWLRRAMEYSCSYPLTGDALTCTINKDATEDEIQIMGCIMLRPDAQGLYHWRGMTFTCSDEYGIEVIKD